jgi:hypothetical protein
MTRKPALGPGGLLRRSLAAAALPWLALTCTAVADQNLCESAALIAAQETGVPPALLLALTRTETGHTWNGRFQPWPWAVNIAGSGSWHPSAAAALAAIEAAIMAGERNVDIGCFQINYRWHGQAFGSVATMLDPLANARYAASFVTELQAELGSWPAAIGAFHSRRPAQAARYLARFETNLRAQAVDLAALPNAMRGSTRSSSAPLSILAGRALLSGNRPALPMAVIPQLAARARPLWETP